jgi:hypothetical protein
VAGVLGEGLLLQVGELGSFVRAEQARSLAHDPRGRPALGIHDVCILEGLVHGSGDGEAAAAHGGEGARGAEGLFEEVVALGVRQDHVHSEAGEEGHDALEGR